MFNVRLAGGHLYGKQLFTWLSLVVSFMASFVQSLFPLDVLDGIWDLIESVSEGFLTYSFKKDIGGGRVERRCWVNFQCRGVLLVWMIVGQGPIALAVGAGGGCLDIFSLIYLFPFLSPSLWETARYRLKYCLKGPLNPKQPTNQLKRILTILNRSTTQFNFHQFRLLNAAQNLTNTIVVYSIHKELTDSPF